METNLTWRHLATRLIQPADYGPLTAMCADPAMGYETVRALADTPEGQAQAYLDIGFKKRAARPGSYFMLAVVTGGQFAGTVTLDRNPQDLSVSQIGWMTGPQLRRKGMATQATALMMRAAMADGVNDFTAVIVIPNEPSVRVAKKLGLMWTKTEPRQGRLTGLVRNVSEYHGTAAQVAPVLSTILDGPC